MNNDVKKPLEWVKLYEAVGNAITGNGFDLSYNLPTTYKDCIQIIKKLNTNSDFISALSNSPNFSMLKDTFSIEKVKINPEKVDDIIKSNLLEQS